MFNLRNRSFLTLSDFTTREMGYMLQLAEDLKKAKYAGTEQKNYSTKTLR
jgi:Ornithine carbamoyltransferase